MPTVADAPCSNVVPSMSAHAIVMSPFSENTTSNDARALRSSKNWALRHSMTNCRLGALPVTAVRTLAEASMFRSSQSGYTAALALAEAAADGMAVWFQAEPVGCTNVTTPLVSTQAVVYVVPYNFTGNGSVTCW